MSNPNELVLKIRTEADLKAGESAQRSLQNALKSVKEGTPAYAALKQQLDGVNAALAGQSATAARAAGEIEKAITATRKAGGKTGGLEAQLAQLRQEHGLAPAAPAGLFGQAKAKLTEAAHEFEAAGGGIKGGLAVLLGSGATVAAWASGIASAVAVAGKALSVFMDKQVQVAKLDAVLANQGKLTDEYREKLQALAGTLAKATATSGNDWLQALTTLNKFGADTGNIDQYAEAVKNLAGFMEGGIPEAAFLFGKAMQGNHAMLTRYGITVDETKSRTEQLADIMRQAAERGGGVLESRAQTLAGQFDAFHGAIKKVWTGLGNLVAQSELVQGSLSLLTFAVNLLAAMLPKTVPKVDGLTNSLAALTPAAREAANKIAELSRAGGDADLGGVKAGADAATAALEKEIGALDRLQAQLDAKGDAELQAKLVEIDNAEAKTPKTAANKARFDKERGDARRANEQRKLGREAGAVALLLPNAQEDATKADAQLQQFRDAAGKPLQMLADEKARLEAETGLKAGAKAATKLEWTKVQAEETRKNVDFAAFARGGSDVPATNPAEIADEQKLKHLQRQIVALTQLQTVTTQYQKSKEEFDKRDGELSGKSIAAGKALADLKFRQQIAQIKQGALTTSAQTEAIKSRQAAFVAQIKDDIAKIETALAKEKALETDARDTAHGGPTAARRTQAKANQALLEKARQGLAAFGEEDANKREALFAGLPPDLVAALNLSRSPQYAGYRAPGHGTATTAAAATAAVASGRAGEDRLAAGLPGVQLPRVVTPPEQGPPLPPPPPAPASPSSEHLPTREVQQAVSTASNQVAGDLRELGRILTRGFGDMRQVVAGLNREMDAQARQLRDLEQRNLNRRP